VLTPDQIDDFVNLTLNNFKKHKWTDISMEYQEYVFAKLVREKAVIEQGGPRIEFKVKTRNTGNARNTGLFSQDSIGVEDVTISATVPWAMQTTGFAYDVDEELFQSDRETIIRILKIREHDALSDMAELNEINLWSAPTGPSDRRPMGIPFWLQKNPSADPEGAFAGGNPAGFAQGAADVSSIEYPRWRNWTFGYRKVNRDDLIRKIKKSLTFTHFRAPVPHPETGYGESKHEMYSTYRVQEPLERLAESRNDNLGADVAKYMNQVTIGGVPLSWVPYLEDNDQTDPIYGINWKVMRPYIKKGCNMRRSEPKVAAKQHTVREVFFDNWMNFCCVNRRMCFVGSLLPA
jgi:hypothetical protein